MRKLTACLLAVIGCGPVRATGVIDDADAAVSRAHAGEGEKYDLYEMTLADLYLIKAKEEQGHARYSEAAQLGADALRFADAAMRKAAERRTSAAAPPATQATVQHPTEPAPPPVPPERTNEKLAPNEKKAPDEKKAKQPIDPGEQH